MYHTTPLLFRKFPKTTPTKKHPYDTVLIVENNLIKLVGVKKRFLIEKQIVYGSSFPP